MRIKFKNGVVTLEDLLAGHNLPWDLTIYESKVLQLITAWCSHQSNFVIHTSGSTGEPKAIKLTRSQLERSAQRTTGFLKLDHRDCAFVCLSVEHIGGMMMVIRSLTTGMDMVIVEPSLSPFNNDFGSLAPTFTAMVPMQLENSLNESHYDSVLKSMKAILLGGAPLSGQLEAKCRSLELPVYQTFGMTETVSHFALRRFSKMTEDPAYEVLDGYEIKTSSEGQLMVKMEKDEPWLLTNDVVRLINSNKFEWLGRADHVVNSGGIKIHPERLEPMVDGILAKLGYDYSFFLTGRSESEFGEILILVIEGDVEETSIDELKKLLKEKLPKYHAPREIHVTDRFCRTENGKVQREETLLKLLSEEI